MRSIAISQPRYLPATNYLQRLYFTDLFVFLDDVQRQSRGWENRNKILMNGKEKWLTIPISSSHLAIINNSKISGRDWVESHKNLIHITYSNHPYYEKEIVNLYYSDVEKALENYNYNFSDVAIKLVLNACKIFGFTPQVVRSSDCLYTAGLKGPNRLFKICEELGASVYISGANGKKYGVIEKFRNSNIKVLFHDYNCPIYKQYKQEGFTPWLSFFDPLFNLGITEVRRAIYKKPVLTEG